MTDDASKTATSQKSKFGSLSIGVNPAGGHFRASATLAGQFPWRAFAKRTRTALGGYTSGPPDRGWAFIGMQQPGQGQ